MNVAATGQFRCGTLSCCEVAYVIPWPPVRCIITCTKAALLGGLIEYCQVPFLSYTQQQVKTGLGLDPFMFFSALTTVSQCMHVYEVKAGSGCLV